MKKLLVLLIALSINIFADNGNKDIPAKIKSALNAKKTEFAVAGVIVSSFLVGGGSIALVRYILKQRSKKQADQDSQDRAAEHKQASIESNSSVTQDTNGEQDQTIASDDENTDQNLTEQSDNTAGSKSVDNSTTPVVAVCETSVSATNAQVNTWQINKDLTDKPCQNFEGHWKVLELDKNGKKSFCIQVFQKSNSDKKVIKQIDVEKQNGLIFASFTRNELFTLAFNNASEEKPLTVLLKYYTEYDDGIERDCTWQKEPWIMC